MAASLSTGGRAVSLKAFRLSDIPLDIRLGAVPGAKVRSDAKLAPGEDGLDVQLARLQAERVEVNEIERQAIERVARVPSDRVYWISLRAWEAVMG
jgi:hypothetical protein